MVLSSFDRGFAGRRARIEPAHPSASCRSAWRATSDDALNAAAIPGAIMIRAASFEALAHELAPSAWGKIATQAAGARQPLPNPQVDKSCLGKIDP
jgi:hypothetical protein